MKYPDDFVNKVVCADCLKAMKYIPDNTIDSIICDPPYGLEFMGKDWDNGVPGIVFWQEMLRVAKPGATLMSFGGTKTYHRMACAIEDAGWVIKDCLMWLHGQGFPKATDISKQLDRKAGKQIKNQSEFTEFSAQTDTTKHIKRYKKCKECGKLLFGQDPCNCKWRNYKGQSDEAQLWNGWKSHGLKPAYEPIIVAMKRNEGSYAENALKWGVAGLNIDGGRIKTNDKLQVLKNDTLEKDLMGNMKGKNAKGRKIEFVDGGLGRFPANLVLECICDEVKEGGEVKSKAIRDKLKVSHFGNNAKPLEDLEYKDKIQIHTNPECPCYMLDKQSGMLTTNSTGKNSPSDYQTKSVFGAGYKSGAKPYKSDTGGASRFFYCAKASRSERLFGLEGYILKQDTPEDIQKEIGNKFMIISKEQYNKLPEKYQKYFKEFRNEHCTVKPLKLMQYLCTLTKTPTGGIVLDPFAGSGTTLIAAKKTGRDFIGIEKEEEYCKIAEARIKATTVQYRLF
jgi:site-specific DNA-methyltransferase (adenine-specific)